MRCYFEYGIPGEFCLDLLNPPCAYANSYLQRTFRKVMRSALAQVRGRVPEDSGEQQQRRREVLALYRWSGDGSGLAL